MDARQFGDYIKNLQKTIKFCTNPEILGIDPSNTEELIQVVSKRFDLDAACFRIVSEKGLFRLVEFGEKLIAIDEDIADLIIYLNKLGYKTTYCCQGHKEKYFHRSYYISFVPSKHNEILAHTIFENLSKIKLDQKALLSTKSYNISATLKKGLIKCVKVEKGMSGQVTFRANYNKPDAVQKINKSILEILEGQK